MNDWKACVGCGEPTLLSLYCSDCFKAQFKRRKPPGYLSSSTAQLHQQMAKLRKAFDAMLAEDAERKK